MPPRVARIAVLFSVLPCLLLAQTRFGGNEFNGEFKGFTKSPTEHIINRYEGVIEARQFEGSVTDPTGAPMVGVIVEVRGPDSSERIKAAVTDERGHFKIGRLRNGTYAFKATCNGFQSVVGKLRIDSGTAKNGSAKIILHVGV